MTLENVIINVPTVLGSFTCTYKGHTIRAWMWEEIDYGEHIDTCACLAIDGKTVDWQQWESLPTELWFEWRETQNLRTFSYSKESFPDLLMRVVDACLAYKETV